MDIQEPKTQKLEKDNFPNDPFSSTGSGVDSHEHDHSNVIGVASRRSVFSRIFSTLLALSITPVVMYAIFSYVVYTRSIKQFLFPPDAIVMDNTIALQFIAVLMVVVVATFIISRSLSRQITRLLGLMHLVGDGELECNAETSSADETVELADAFNSMVSRLRARQRREQIVSELKSEFISVAAHQLRTPLSAIKWTFRMLIDGDIGELSEEQKQFLQRGYQTNEHMIGLVNDLLNATRIEQGHFGYEFSSIDLTAYLRGFLAGYDHQAKSHNMEIIYHESKENFPNVDIDKSKMDLVLQNILDNSIKYSKSGGHVIVTVKKIPEFIEISIADNGFGIPKHQLGRVFSKFFRGDNIVRMSTEGTGLGLFIVRNIIKNHGGDIRVESEENKGTEITFTIPINREKIPKKEVIFEETEKHS